MALRSASACAQAASRAARSPRRRRCRALPADFPGIFQQAPSMADGVCCARKRHSAPLARFGATEAANSRIARRDRRLHKPKAFAGIIRRASRSGSSELQRGGVNAIAETGGRRTVRKDVAQVAAATRTGYLHAAHSIAQVLMLLDGFGIGGNHEAGPSAAGVEL